VEALIHLISLGKSRKNVNGLLERKSLKLATIVLLLLITLTGYSTNYYVSSSMGNDANSGTSEKSAWRSLDKVNSFTPKPGDQILFKRGDSWIGTIYVKASGSSGSSIVYGAYGSGETPKIYGSEEVTGWTRHSESIWKAKVEAGDVTQLFLNDDRMQLARYPDKGYFNVTTKTSNTVFSSTDLDGGINYTGATCFVKSNPWAINSTEVSGSSSQKITLASSPTYGVTANYGFWLTNKLEFLTRAGEWYYDSGTNMLYFWTQNGDSPGNYSVRVSKIKRGIDVSSKSYIAIKDIELLHHEDGVYITKSNYIDVTNCKITNPDGFGIYESTNAKIVIDNNSFEGTNSGIRTWYSTGTKITNNLFQNTGQLRNLNKTIANQDLMAVFVRGNNHVIQYNRIINTGYIGINSTGLNVNIKYNYVDGACQVLDDGAGIYVSSSSSGAYPKNDYTVGTIIENNIVTNVHGVKEGKPANSAYPHGNGIYLDWSSKGVTVRNNTVNFVSQGIYIQGGGQNIVEGNTFMDGMIGYRYNAGNEDILFSKNIVYQTARLGQHILTTSTTANQKLTFSYTGKYGGFLFDDNIYVARYSQTNIFRYTKSDGGAAYTNDFFNWKSQTAQDKNSTFIDTPLSAGETEQLFYNDTKQSKTFNLGTTVYRDIFGKEVTGKLTLEPFTSKILIKTTKTVQVNQSPEINDQSFNIAAPIDQNEFIGQVIASDPDSDQTLGHSIVDGNELNFFAINSATGEIFANADIQQSDDQTYILTVKVTDNADAPLSASAEITINISGGIEDKQEPDNISPTISSFSIPDGYNSLTVPVSSFSATDNVEVTGYLLTESNVTPSTEHAGWSVAPPEEYIFSTAGTHDLFAWVKDASGNISSPVRKTVVITLPDLSPMYSEYLFEETGGVDIIDSENSNDGIIVNDGLRVDGANGRGLAFSGSGYIALGQCFGENVQNEVSMSAWIKPNANSSGYQGIIMHGGPNTDTYALYIYPNTKTIGFKTSGTTPSWFAIDNVNKLWDGNWHHLVAVYNGTEKTVYLDNEVIGVISSEGTIDSGYGYNLLVGAARDETNPTLLYDGLLDEVRIYNYAISTSEVGEMFHPVNRELNKIYTVEDITICEGEDYMGWTAPGEYERILQRKLESASGADSIVTTNLYVNPVYTLTTDAAICKGETYRFGAQVLSEPGEYTEVFETINGCDSTVVLTLTVNESHYVTEDVIIAEGEEYSGWTESGVYERNLVASTGCDSTIVTSLRVISARFTSEDVSVCEGSSYNGWTTSGRYERTLESVSGGDSIVVTNLTVNPVYTVTADAAICKGETYRFGAQVLSEPGEYTEVFETINGCDSTVVLTLTVNEELYVTEDITISSGENYNGWTEEGNYQRNLVSVTGCDSTVVTNLTVEQMASQTIYLDAGWNIISSYLIPDDVNMEAVMASLQSSGDLVKVQDESNNTFEYRNKNVGWTNGIGNYQKTEGYKIQVNSSCALEVRGQKISLPLNIPLSGGWNIVSFPGEEAVDAMQLVQSLIDAGILVKVQDEAGNSIEYWNKHGWLNGIGNFEPGEGYIIQVKSAGMLTIDEFYTKSGQIVAKSAEPTYFQADYEGNGVDHMNINIVELAGSGLKAGDEIAAFDNTICVGAVKLTEQHFELDVVSIPASAAEEGLNNGFFEGNAVELKVWNSDTGEEMNLSSEVVEGDMVYNRQASVFVAMSELTVGVDELTAFNIEIDVYPNPATDNVNIRFSAMPEIGAAISIFDISGKQLISRVIESDITVMNIENLKSGVYFVKIPVKGGIATRKLIKR